MASPQDITLNPDGSVVKLQWAESGSASEPSSGRKATGLEIGDEPPPDDFNWPHREAMRWLRAMFSRYPKASDAFFASWMPAGDFGIWVDTGINDLDVFLSNSGAVSSVVADVWVDPPIYDTGAVRVQVSVPLAEPQSLPPLSDVYVYVPIDLVAPPTVSRTELAFLAVPIGDPIGLEPANFVQVWKITTDATGIASQEILLPRFPALKTIGVASLNATELEVEDLHVQDALTVDGYTSMQALTAYDVAQFNLTTMLSASPGQVTYVGNDATNYFIVYAQSIFNFPTYFSADVHIPYDTLYSYGVTVNYGVVGDLIVNGDVGLGVGIGTTAVDIGVSTADTLSINATIDAPVAVAVTDAGVAMNVVNAGGPGIAVAVSSGYGVSISPDSSSPTHAALHLGTQDADPSSPTQGNLFHNSSRGAGKLRHRALAAWESVHSSPKGYVFGVSTPATSSSVTTSGDICDVTILPEQTGDVLVVVTGFWKAAADTTTMDILLKDITGSVTIATSQTLVAPDRDGDGADRTVPFEYRMPYTLPSAASRLFRARLNVSALVNWYDVLLTVLGTH
jgi:hypothetical protein